MGALHGLALPSWPLLIPAMLLHGLTLVSMFAPMHECTHRTAFASPTANVVVGWLAGLLSFYNSTFYRYFHAWHHRYTQDPARDPELMFPRADTLAAYVREVTTIGFWHRRIVDYTILALGRARLPFLPESARRTVAISVSCQFAIYAVLLAVIPAGFTAPLYFFFLPTLLGAVKKSTGSFSGGFLGFALIGAASAVTLAYVSRMWVGSFVRHGGRATVEAEPAT